MDKSVVTNYINTFRNVFGGYLKPGVGIQIKISELPSEVFICVSVGINKMNSTNYSTKFLNMNAAFNHYGFTQNISEMGSSEGTQVIIQKTKFAIIKKEDINYLSEEKAKSDAVSIVNHIMNSNTH